jgi:hypothetical protein
MNLDRRFCKFLVRPDDLAALLRGEARVASRPLPPDAEIVRMDFDYNREMLAMVVHSVTFDPVEPDREVPLNLNGPIIEETA